MPSFDKKFCPVCHKQVIACFLVKLRINITRVFRNCRNCPRRCATRAISVISENTRDIYTLFDGFTDNTRGYFTSCVVFFRAPQGRGKIRATSKMSASIICENHRIRNLLFHYLAVYSLCILKLIFAFSCVCRAPVYVKMT